MCLERCFDFQSVVGNENTIYDNVPRSPVELQQFMFVFIISAKTVNVKCKFVIQK